jgi:hypothetical protein
MDLVDKGLVSLLYLQQFFKSAPKWYRKRFKLVVFGSTLSAFCSMFNKSSTLDPFNGDGVWTSKEQYALGPFIDKFYSPLLKELHKELENNKRKFGIEFLNFICNFWFINVTRKNYHSIPAFLNFINLGFYKLLYNFIVKDLWSLIKTEIELERLILCMDNDPLQYSEFPSLIRALDVPSISSIKWGDKIKVKKMATMISHVAEDIISYNQGNLIRWKLYFQLEQSASIQQSHLKGFRKTISLINNYLVVSVKDKPMVDNHFLTGTKAEIKITDFLPWTRS